MDTLQATVLDCGFSLRLFLSLSIYSVYLSVLATLAYGYDHDRCGSTTVAISMLVMVTIISSEAIIVAVMKIFDSRLQHFLPPLTFLTGTVFRKTVSSDFGLTIQLPR